MRARLFSASTTLALSLWLNAQGPIPALLEQFKTQPNDWKLCNQIAVSYTQAQKFEDAAEFFRKVIALNPSFVPARKNLGVVLWFAGRRGESEKQLRALLPLIPNDPVPHLYLGIACHDRKQHREAAGHFEKAGDLAIQNPEVLPAALESDLAAGNRAVVPAALRFAAETGDAQLSIRLAEILTANGIYDAAITLLEPLPHLAVNGRLLLAEAYDRQNQPDRAYATYAKALADHPEEEQVYTSLAVFASTHQNNRFALETIDRGLARRPHSALLLVHRGLLTAIEGDRDGAERSLRAAADADPKRSISVLALGVLQLEGGKIEDAVTAFRRAVRQFPAEQTGYYFLGLALQRSGDAGRPEAVSVLQKAVGMDPADARAQVLLGQALLAAGQTKAGIGELERALQTDSKNATALYQLSLAYRKSGNPALAEQRMKAFREVKSAADEGQTELVQFLKILK